MWRLEPLCCQLETCKLIGLLHFVANQARLGFECPIDLNNYYVCVFGVYCIVTQVTSETM